jgi:catechol 2,3-dioxygenase-like lactoylglutathione lyase family enzyme
MNVRFDHLSLSAKEPEIIRDFLVDLLGFTIGSRPNLSFNGYFLFAGNKDVVHIFAQSPNRKTLSNSGLEEQNIVHHVSFFSDDYQEVMTRIEQLGLSYSLNQVPGSKVKQIFVRAPENLIVEIQAIPTR